MFIKYFIAITVLFFAVKGFADDTYGLFMVVKGDIKVTLAKDKSEVAAKVGMKVNSGDSISAGVDSRAKVVMSDKNVLNISPDSKIVIEKYENDGKDKKNVELNVLYGKVRASVEQKYDGEKSKFNVKTPTAVAGVRGTDFLTSFNRETKVSQIVTFKGVVAVGKPGPGGAILDPVFVKKGQTTSAKEGQTPDQPKAMAKEDLNKENNESGDRKPANEKSMVDDKDIKGEVKVEQQPDPEKPKQPAPPQVMATPTPPPPPPPPPSTPPPQVKTKSNVNIIIKPK